MSLTEPTQQEPNAQHVSDWHKRPYAASDEDVVVYIWLKAYRYSRYGRARLATQTGERSEREYWEDQRGPVEYLLKSAETMVAAAPGASSQVWAFASYSGDTVHYFAVKHSVIEEMCQHGPERHRELARLERQAHKEALRVRRPAPSKHVCEGEAFAAEMLRDLLGGRLERECGMTHEIDWAGSGLVMPLNRVGKPLWFMDSTWFGRQLCRSRRAA